MFDTFTDAEIRSLHDAYKLAVLARKEIVEWTSGDTSVRKQVTINVGEHGAAIAREFRRRFPDQVRDRFTRTKVAFA